MNEFETHSQIWCEVETGAIETIKFCGGSVAVFSQRCPTRDTSPNEDSACLVVVDPETGLLAVADGVGGAAVGNEASQTAVEHLVESCFDLPLSEEHEVRGLRAEILDAFESANAEILDWGRGSGTTLTAIELVDSRIRSYHVGDSGALLISNHGNIKYATVGHAPIAQAIEIGMIDEEEGLSHEDRNLITNCLGSREMKIEIGPRIEMAARDTLLIASDGLFDNLTREEISEFVRKGDLSDGLAKLVEIATERMMQEDEDKPSKPDDLTVMCYRRVNH